jgi:hypothetical protein
MIAVIEPFINGQKAIIGPASNYCFSPPFKVTFLADFRVAIFDSFGIGRASADSAEVGHLIRRKSAACSA